MQLLVHQTNYSATQKLFIHSFFLATLIHNDEILICNSNFLISLKQAAQGLTQELQEHYLASPYIKYQHSPCSTEKYT